MTRILFNDLLMKGVEQGVQNEGIEQKCITLQQNLQAKHNKILKLSKKCNETESKQSQKTKNKSKLHKLMKTLHRTKTIRELTKALLIMNKNYKTNHNNATECTSKRSWCK